MEIEDCPSPRPRDFNSQEYMLRFIRLTRLKVKRVQAVYNYNTVFNLKALFDTAKNQSRQFDEIAAKLLPCLLPIIYDFLFAPGVMHFCTIQRSEDAQVSLFVHQLLYKLWIHANWIAKRVHHRITVTPQDFALLRKLIKRLDGF